MKMHQRLFGIMLIFLLLVSCSQKKEQANQPAPSEKSEQTTVSEQAEDKGNEEKVEVQDEQDPLKALASTPLPQTLEEIVQYPVGKFSSMNEPGVDEALNKVPKLPESISEEDEETLLAYLYSLIKKEYKMPEQAFAGINSIDGSNPDKTEEKETFNVEIILDASGSMGKKIGQKTMMEIAKEAIKKFAADLPEEANVGLRVYGHKGSGSNADKAISCASNELVYPIQPYNEANLSAALAKFNPAGWTPLAQAIIEAEQDLAPYKGEHHRNIIYLVSDGIETCGGNPVAAAKSLKDSEISPIVNIIGFAVSGKDQQQLKDVAAAAGGTYVDVRNLEQMNEQFKKTVEEFSKWIGWKIEEEKSVIQERNEQFSIAHQSIMNWGADLRQEQYLIQGALIKLQSEGKITNKQLNQIYDRTTKYYRERHDQVNELNKELRDIREGNFDEKLKKIREMYKGKSTDTD
ncbi:VWA domain-containing protein [Bacillus sp. Bva_UNVM-123]|uniref:VWA domain-containing protein n=1 Tax=Bacillus sp. Bva_UNVM-123 TaxID=2829798 RepID=UPI00391FC296